MGCSPLKRSVALAVLLLFLRSTSQTVTSLTPCRTSLLRLEEMILCLHQKTMSCRSHLWARLNVSLASWEWICPVIFTFLEMYSCANTFQFLMLITRESASQKRLEKSCFSFTLFFIFSRSLLIGNDTT